jgi:hypothetical protein
MTQKNKVLITGLEWNWFHSNRFSSQRDITRTHYTKCCVCSSSWGWASNARDMQRLLIVIKWITNSSRWIRYTDRHRRVVVARTLRSLLNFQSKFGVFFRTLNPDWTQNRDLGCQFLKAFVAVNFRSSILLGYCSTSLEWLLSDISNVQLFRSAVRLWWQQKNLISVGALWTCKYLAKVRSAMSAVVTVAFVSN